mmetsp:Transcript_54912/g.98909  ORF Transcript_54912/g.98909 Transcript_54912/m.98909 type:complete len:277 (+) Transcript_54912:93-923(+)
MHLWQKSLAHAAQCALRHRRLKWRRKLEFAEHLQYAIQDDRVEHKDQRPTGQGCEVDDIRFILQGAICTRRIGLPLEEDGVLHDLGMACRKVLSREAVELPTLGVHHAQPTYGCGRHTPVPAAELARARAAVGACHEEVVVIQRSRRPIEALLFNWDDRCDAEGGTVLEAPRHETVDASCAVESGYPCILKPNAAGLGGGVCVDLHPLQLNVGKVVVEPEVVAQHETTHGSCDTGHELCEGPPHPKQDSWPPHFGGQLCCDHTYHKNRELNSRGNE